MAAENLACVCSILLLERHSLHETWKAYHGMPFTLMPGAVRSRCVYPGISTPVGGYGFEPAHSIKAWSRIYATPQFLTWPCDLLVAAVLKIAMKGKTSPSDSPPKRIRKDQWIQKGSSSVPIVGVQLMLFAPCVMTKGQGYIPSEHRNFFLAG